MLLNEHKMTGRELRHRHGMRMHAVKQLVMAMQVGIVLFATAISGVGYAA